METPPLGGTWSHGRTQQQPVPAAVSARAPRAGRPNGQRDRQRAGRAVRRGHAGGPAARYRPRVAAQVGPPGRGRRREADGPNDRGARADEAARAREPRAAPPMAGSTGGRNDLCELLRWCHVAEGLARTSVEASLDVPKVGRADVREVDALGQVLAEEPIGVLVGAALPGRVWVADCLLYTSPSPQTRH